MAHYIEPSVSIDISSNLKFSCLTKSEKIITVFSFFCRREFLLFFFSSFLLNRTVFRETGNHTHRGVGEVKREKEKEMKN
jgi:hypothetical protein